MLNKFQADFDHLNNVISLKLAYIFLLLYYYFCLLLKQRKCIFKFSEKVYFLTKVSISILHFYFE